jgi:hypothetical protein
MIETSWGKGSNEGNIENFSLGLLQTDNCTTTFINFVTNCITFAHIINTTNIPTQNVPRPIIHRKQAKKIVHLLGPA